MLLHRRITNNAFESHNLNLTLNDTSVLHTSLWMLLDNRTHSSQLQHQAWLQLENPPHMYAIDLKAATSGSWVKTVFPDKTG